MRSEEIPFLAWQTILMRAKPSHDTTCGVEVSEVMAGRSKRGHDTGKNTLPGRYINAYGAKPGHDQVGNAAAANVPDRVNLVQLFLRIV
jgi:hypothetical protein